MKTFTFRLPDSEADWQSVWELNHAVFSAELGQHPVAADGRLTDRFHAGNLYRVAWQDERAAGMITAHFQAPFSAVERFGQSMADQVLPGETAEIRLFAVRPEFRRTPLPLRLAASLLAELSRRGVKRLIISGYEERRRLYERIGFRIVGEAVRDGNAVFHPMATDLATVLTLGRGAMTRCLA